MSAEGFRMLFVVVPRVCIKKLMQVDLVRSDCNDAYAMESAENALQGRTNIGRSDCAESGLCQPL